MLCEDHDVCLNEPLNEQLKTAFAPKNIVSRIFMLYMFDIFSKLLEAFLLKEVYNLHMQRV